MAMKNNNINVVSSLVGLGLVSLASISYVKTQDNFNNSIPVDYHTVIAARKKLDYLDDKIDDAVRSNDSTANLRGQYDSLKVEARRDDSPDSRTWNKVYMDAKSTRDIAYIFTGVLGVAGFCFSGSGLIGAYKLGKNNPPASRDPKDDLY